jgi:hypothetical protein
VTLVGPDGLVTFGLIFWGVVLTLLLLFQGHATDDVGKESTNNAVAIEASRLPTNIMEMQRTSDYPTEMEDHQLMF